MLTANLKTRRTATSSQETDWAAAPASDAGTTLVEVIIAMAILGIAAVGALGYQYYANMQARVAHAQITATRIGLLLLEDWKSTGGSGEYDPTTLEFGFESIFIPGYFSQGQGQGVGAPLRNEAYAITVDNVPLTMVLKWQDIQTDDTAQMTLRQLSAVVRFDEPEDVSGSLTLYNPAIILTTYVRLDASGG
jgi:prepilin-type N-terminal cleavage/methylation domain-containing protein